MSKSAPQKRGSIPGHIWSSVIAPLVVAAMAFVGGRVWEATQYRIEAEEQRQHTIQTVSDEILHRIAEMRLEKDSGRIPGPEKRQYMIDGWMVEPYDEDEAYGLRPLMALLTVLLDASGQPDFSNLDSKSVIATGRLSTDDESAWDDISELERFAKKLSQSVTADDDHGDADMIPLYQLWLLLFAALFGLGGLLWLSTIWYGPRRSQRVAKQERLQAIGEELAFRRRLLPREVSGQMAGRDIVRQASEIARSARDAPHFVHADLRDRSMASLLWELAALSDDDSTKERLKELAGRFMELSRPEPKTSPEQLVACVEALEKELVGS